MAERVQVIVEAKDAASGILRGITSQFGALGSIVEELTGSSVNWGNAVAIAGELAIDVVKESIKQTISYADEVRRLSLISGASAEDTSRLIQLTADYNVQVSDLEAATRKLTQNGLSPTVETIADLSDEFLKLNPGQQRAAFLMDNFGRSGQNFAELMSLGGDALREMNGAIDENLILTQDNLDQAREYTLALDEWQDAIQGVKIEIGTGLLPVLTDLMTHTQAVMEADRMLAQEGLPYGSKAYNERRQVLIETIKAEQEQEQALKAQTKALDEAGATAATVATTDYKKLLDMTLKLNDATLEQIQQMAYQDLYKQLADDVDGLTQAERNMLNEIGVELGIFDQKAVDTAERVYELNQSFIEGALNIQDYIDKLNAIPTYINTTVSVTGGGSLPPGTVPNPPIDNPVEGRSARRGENENIAGGSKYFYGNTTFIVGGEGSDFMENR